MGENPLPDPDPSKTKRDKEEAEDEEERSLDRKSAAAPDRANDTKKTKTILVEGDPVTIDQNTTVADLKDMVGASPDDVAVFRQGDDLIALNETDHPTDYVPDSGKLAFQPAKKQPFG